METKASQLISDDYLNQNQILHDAELTYGTSGWQFADRLSSLCQEYKTWDVLDYGCGKGTLANALTFPIQQYDPALPEFSGEPQPADIVVCGDVMEHIEPDCVDAVLDDVCRLTKKATFWVIATRPAGKTLPDGRNCHLIVENAEWWAGHLTDKGLVIVDRYTWRKGEAVFVTEPPAVTWRPE